MAIWPAVFAVEVVSVPLPAEVEVTYWLPEASTALPIAQTPAVKNGVPVVLAMPITLPFELVVRNALVLDPRVVVPFIVAPAPKVCNTPNVYEWFGTLSQNGMPCFDNEEK